MSILNTEDIIDSRDIIARIDELEGDLDCCASCGEGLPNEADHRNETTLEYITDCPDCDQEIMTEDDREELANLRDLASECKDYSDWKYGEALINEEYFTEYCMDMLKNIGDLPQDIPSYIAIDEEQTAENMKDDYMTVDFDGATYYMRAC